MREKSVRTVWRVRQQYRRAERIALTIGGALAVWLTVEAWPGNLSPVVLLTLFVPVVLPWALIRLLWRWTRQRNLEAWQ
jgi:hypothetical protein